MDIPGISAGDGSYGATNPFGAQTLDRDAFMKLLVTQLKNQDPLQPTANEEFVAQLATFSSLEQLETLNDNTVAMIALNQSNALLAQLTQGSALIGKTVTWTDPQTLETSSGTVASVKIVEGLAILNVDGTDVPLAAVSEVLDAPQGDGA
jgi:flagellar basal-body rod modification protein FlgD